MKHLNFLTKSGSQSMGLSSVTLASTVGSPSAHRRWTMLKLISVLVLILTIGVGNVWGADATMAAGTNGSSATVSGANAIKVGTSSKGGTMTITVPSGANVLHLKAAAWNGVSGLSLNITPTNKVGTTSIALTANSGIANNSPFTFSGDVTSSYMFDIPLNNISSNTTLTFTSSTTKRFVVWGAKVCYNPTALTNGTITSNSARVSWTDSYNVNSYDVYRSTSNTAPAANATPTATVTNKYADLTGLNAGTTYYWWVRAKDGDCKTNWIAGSSFTTTAAAFTITAQSNNTSYGTVSGTTTITASPKSGYRVSTSNPYSVSPANSATVSQNGNAFTVTPSANTTITINFEEIPSHNIIFNTGGLVSIDNASVKEGVIYNIPSSANTSVEGALTENCEYGTFVGWTTASSIADASVSPSIITSYTMSTSDVTLHAVYSKTESSGSTATNTVTETFANQTSHSSENNWQQELSWPTSESNASIAWTTYFGKITSGYTEIRTYSNGTMGWLCSGAITGLKKVKFKGWHVNADDAADMVVSYSTNGGTSWTELGTHTATANNSSESDEYEITNSNPSTSYLLKIALSDATCPSSSNKKYRIDDIVITTESAAPDVTTYSLDANCCNPLGAINGTFNVANNVEVDGTDITVSLVAANLVEGAAGYRFVLYDNAATPTKITSKDINETSNVSCTFGSSDGITVGTTYKVSVITLGDGSTNCAVGGESSKIAVEVPNLSVWTVSYNKNTEDEVTGMPSGTQILQTVGTGNLSNDTPARTGYTFVGWSDASGANNTKNYNAGGSITITGDKTVYAVWTATNYSVTMTKSPAAAANDEAVIVSVNKSSNNHYGDQITVSVTAHPGYVFTGWSADPSVTFANASAESTTFSMPASNVTITANFTKILTVAEARTIIDGNDESAKQGVYAKGIVSQIVTAYNSTYHNISYNISTDGLTTSNQLQAYRGKSYNGDGFTSADDIQVGDEVVVYGNLTKYNSTYEFAEANQLYSLKRLSSIAVKTAPTKVTYTANDHFDPTGLVITLTYSNSDTEDVAYAGHESDFTFSPTTSASLNASNATVQITYKGKSANQAITVSRIATELGWSAASYEATQGDDYSFPTLTTTPNNLSGVTYTSSNTNVATINANGNITVKTYGETTITASFAQTNVYAAATPATYTLTILEDMTPRLVVDPSSLTFSATPKDDSAIETFNLVGTHLGANATLAITSATEGDAAMFSVVASVDKNGSGAINQNITVTYTPTAAGSHSATLTISSTGAADVTVALSGTALETDIYKSALHTEIAAWSDYDAGKKMAGNGYSVPTPGSVSKGSDNCEGNHYRFAGWVEDNYKEAPTGHIDAASGTKNASGKVYWAVWEKETAVGDDTYEMTTSVAVGDVVVIAEIDQKADGKAGKELTSISTTSTKYGLAADFTTLPEGTKEWTVVTGYNSTGVAFQNSSNYLYWTSGNSLDVDATLSANTSWTVTTDSERAKIVNNSDDSRIICWNSSSNARFAAYASKEHGAEISGGGNFYYPVFYKKVPGVVYGDPITYCCTPHDITISNSIEHGTVEADLASACAGTEITLSMTPTEGYEFESLTVAGEDVTAGVVENEYSFDMINDDVVVSATFNKIAVTNVTINGYSSVAKGANITLTLEITPSTARPTVVWTSSNNEIATVANGVVTGVAQGNVTITATVDGTDYTKAIEVTRETKLNSITVVNPKTAYTLNEEFVAPRVDANYLYVDDESEAPTLEDVEGATFDDFDNQHAGEQTITVTYGGKTTTYDVTVSAWTLNLQTKAQTGPSTVTPSVTEVTINTYGSEIDLTDYYVANLCEEYTQVGFIASNADVDSETEPENLLTAYTPTEDNQTLYAVFSHTGYTGKVLVDEDFSSITEASSNKEISASDFSWIAIESKVFPEVGYVKYGSGSYVGSITSIELDLSHKFKVSMGVMKYNTDGANIKITADETEWTSSTSFNTTDFTSINHVFDAVGEDKQITIETSSANRAYIDNIKIETLDEIGYTSVYDCRSDMTVTYAIATADAEAGATGACEQETVKQGNDYTVCTDEPTWAGHTFAGWSDGESIVGATIVNVQAPITLTATWNEIAANTIAISSDAITAGTMTIDDGRKATLTVTFDPENTYNKTITWSTDSHYDITDKGDGTYELQAKNYTTDALTVTATTANSKSASFSLVINQATKLTGLTLEGLTEANMVYTIGDAFSTTGIVVNTTVNMGDAPEDVEADFSTPDMTSAGVKTVTVEYTHPEYGYASTTYDITVNAKYVHLYRNEALIETRTLNSTAESVTLPDGDNATWAPKVAGYSLIGFADAADAQYPKVAAGASYVPSVQEISLYALYTNVVPTYTLIESANDLVLGRSIIIATKDAATQDSKHYAIGELNVKGNGTSDNRKGVEVTKGNEGTTLTAYAGATEFILMEGTTPGTYALYDPINGKYLCAQATNSNYLKLEATLSANGSWTISTNSVVSNTTGNRKYLYFNYNNGDGNSRLFSCYAENAQNMKAIAVYQSNVAVEYDPTMEMEVTTAQTLNTADVDESVNVIVKNGGELTIGSAMEINNLTVEAGGEVIVNAPLQADGIHLGVENTMTVNSTVNVPSFSISVKLGSTGEATNVTVSGSGNIAAPEGYVDMELSNDANPDQWHAFTVPFEVDALNGIYDAETGAPLQNEVNYAIMDYHGDIRAQGKYGWKKYRSILQPGVFYLITVDGASKVLRFMKKAGSSYVAPNSMAMTYYGDGDNTNTNNGWCGVGNQNMFGGYVPFKAQILNSTGTGYEAYNANTTKFSACIPFFIQIESDDNLAVSTTLPSSVAARRVAAKGINDIKVTFGNENYSDKLYISANEDAKNAYEVGKDLVKMTMSNTPVIPQIFGKAYGNKLCMVYAPMSNDQAVYDLSLYAPANGEYVISCQPSAISDQYIIYLTKDGAIIWNLTMSEYPISLNKGTTEGYGLLLKAKAPQTPTGVEQSEVNHQPSDIQKIIIDDNVFILRSGQMYDVTGKAVK